MKINYHKKFQKNYLKRIKHNRNLDKIFKERTLLFSENPEHPLLDDHKLAGDKSGCRSFSITGDIRVVYIKVDKNHVLFLDIGSHNQVY